MNIIDIYKVEDFEKLRNLESGNYHVNLYGNIYFNDYNSYEDPKSYYNYLKEKQEKKDNYEGFEPIILNNVNMIFDGNNHEIFELFISRENEDNVGLFNCINSTITINDLCITDAFIIGKNNVGVLGGILNGKVNNSFISGQVEAKSNAGMICGASNQRLNVLNVISYGNIICQNSIGSLCGESNILTVQNYDFIGTLKNSNDEKAQEKMCPSCFMFSETFPRKEKKYTL